MKVYNWGIQQVLQVLYWGGGGGGGGAGNGGGCRGGGAREWGRLRGVTCLEPAIWCECFPGGLGPVPVMVENAGPFYK